MINTRSRIAQTAARQETALRETECTRQKPFHYLSETQLEGLQRQGPGLFSNHRLCFVPDRVTSCSIDEFMPGPCEPFRLPDGAAHVGEILGVNQTGLVQQSDMVRDLYIRESRNLDLDPSRPLLTLLKLQEYGTAEVDFASHRSPVVMLSATLVMSLYDAAKKILDKAPADNMELQRSVMDVMNLALKSDQELAQARERIAALEKSLATEKSLVLKSGVYWMPSARSGLEGPYCPACWGTNRNLVPMLLKETAIRGEFWATCPIHNKPGDFTIKIPPE